MHLFLLRVLLNELELQNNVEQYGDNGQPCVIPDNNKIVFDGSPTNLFEKYSSLKDFLLIWRK